MSIDISGDNSRVSLPFNRCIYCDETDGPLQKEHVIPKGLGGGVILLRASCKECAKITSNFELRCLRDHFGEIRASSAYPSRRNKLSGLSRDLARRRDGVEWVENIPLNKHPSSLVLPSFTQPPRLLSGWEPPVPDLIDWVLFSAPSEDEYLVSRNDRLHDDVCRLLAKISYGMAVSNNQSGQLPGVLVPYVIDAILGRSTDFGLYIGCDLNPDKTIVEGKLHRGYFLRSTVFARPVRGKKIVLCRLQIFADIGNDQLGTPIYLVAVGELQ